jgi:hypothetical protein
MGFRGVVPRLFTVLAVAGLCACEAPLVLDHVKQQRSKTTQRSDLFQAAASNSNAIVVVGNRGVLITSRDRGETIGAKPGNAGYSKISPSCLT